MRHAWMIAAVALSSSIAQAAKDPPAIPSQTFKDSVTAALSENDGTRRAALLMEALHRASDKEVFFVFPVLFPHEVLDGAAKSGVCTPELSASLGLIQAYMKGSVDRETFAKERASEIRPATDNLIVCLHRYYKDGQLRLPGQQSNNSFKPKPLRGSA